MVGMEWSLVETSDSKGYELFISEIYRCTAFAVLLWQRKCTVECYGASCCLPIGLRHSLLQYGANAIPVLTPTYCWESLYSVLKFVKSRNCSVFINWQMNKLLRTSDAPLLCQRRKKLLFSSEFELIRTFCRSAGMDGRLIIGFTIYWKCLRS